MQLNDSLAIKICRVLCIFFMTYVHVNPGKDNWPDDIPDYLANIGYLLSDLLGRASVPALSVLGGYLAVSAYQRRANWWKYAKERFQTLIIPLITWNIVIILVSLIILWITGTQNSVIRDFQPFDQITFWLIFDRITAINTGSATMALNFLRDFFVCSLLLPLIVQLIKRFNVVGLSLIWFLGLTWAFAPIVMRPNILMFFSVGVYLALQSKQLIPSKSTILKTSTALLIPLALVYFLPINNANFQGNVAQTILRLVVSTIFLIIAISLSRTYIGKLIGRFEPLAYLMFLSHQTIMMLFWGVWQLAFGKSLLWPYVLFFIFAPFATLLVLVKLHKTMCFLPELVQKVFTGKKIVV